MGSGEQGNLSIAGEAVKGSFYSVTASAATLVLGLTRSIVLARLLVPQDYGVVALALLYLGLAAQLRGLGLDNALIHRQNPDQAFMKTYFSLRTGLDLAVACLLLAAIPLLCRAYPLMTGLGRVLRVLLVAYLLSNLSQVQETLLRKELAFSRLALIDVVASVVMTVCALYAASIGWGVWALVVERLSGMGTRFLLSWGPFRRCWPGLGWDKEEGRWLWRFGKPTWVASNLGYLLDRFDDFWVGAFLGKMPLGYYAKSYEFARYPRRVFANPLVSVLRSIFARVQDDRLQLSRIFYRSAHVILRTGFVLAGVFALVMPEFIRLVIGEKWMPMLWTFRLMLVYTALDSLLMLIDNLMMAVGQPQQLKSARVAQAIFFVPAVIVGAQLWGINGVALAADGMLVAGVWRLYRPLRKIVDFSVTRLALWPCIALMFAWGAGFFVETHVDAGLWVGLLLKPGVFCACFVLLLGITERGDYFRGARGLWRAVRGD